MILLKTFLISTLVTIYCFIISGGEVESDDKAKEFLAVLGMVLFFIIDPGLLIAIICHDIK